MNIIQSENDGTVIKEAYTAVAIETNEGKRLYVCLRDLGFDVHVMDAPYDGKPDWRHIDSSDDIKDNKPKDAERFIVGCCYKHGSGRRIRIMGSMQMFGNGDHPVLMAEERETGKYVAVGRHGGATANWHVISYEEYGMPVDPGQCESSSKKADDPESKYPVV